MIIRYKQTKMHQTTHIKKHEERGSDVKHLLTDARKPSFYLTNWLRGLVAVVIESFNNALAPCGVSIH